MNVKVIEGLTPTRVRLDTDRDSWGDHLRAVVQPTVRPDDLGRVYVSFYGPRLDTIAAGQTNAEVYAYVTADDLEIMAERFRSAAIEARAIAARII